MFGYPELILILAIVLLLFGSDKLPEIARSLGKSTSEFKKAQLETDGLNNLKELPKDNDINKDTNSDEKVRKLATEIGIDIKNKTIEQLIDEIHAKVRLRPW